MKTTTNKMSKLDYYLSMSYLIELYKIPEEEGGGYSACIPQLGRNSFIGDGETPQEAYNNLERIKKEFFEEILAEGKEIPLPVLDEDIEEYSGKFIIRVPKYLHKNIDIQAKKNGSSLNSFVVSLIQNGFTYLCMNDMVDYYSSIINNMDTNRHEFNLKLESSKSSNINNHNFDYEKVAYELFS